VIPGVAHRRQFKHLSEQEVLALAVSSEEDDARIYRWYAQRLRPEYPKSAQTFDEMAATEDEHRAALTDEHRRRFGDAIPLIRREHVAGFYTRRPVWLIQNLGLNRIRAEAERMEIEAREFYQRAAKRTTDAGTRQLLNRLAAAESGHEHTWHSLVEEHLPPEVRTEEDAEAHRQFVLTWVQPGLAGLMDGSVSTLAPIFAAAFATGDTWQTFLVGLAASVGAGISMGFTEAASDDVMTAVGGLGHALPYLIPNFWTATAIAMVVVFVELWVIAWIQNRYMDTPFWRAALQVVLGGSLVFASGILIGSA
jgi:rubrerythrin